MPLTAFIIRPFGKKPVDKIIKEVQREGESAKKFKVVESVEINFEYIHEKLIKPALEASNIKGITTGAMLAGGNIREDMFHLLVTADLVIADVTLHNPNVFYELGIRHAFYDKYTFLIRSTVSTYPFDLQTDRYFQYDHERPEDSVAELSRALLATLSSEQTDSPVFRLLPRLRSEDRSRFINVPPDFMEEVERARKHKLSGDLRLLGVECEGFLWEIEGLRAIGRAQFELNYIYGAKVTWELIAARYPYDVEANTILSTIYQRLNEPVRSEQALTRLSLLNTLDINTVADIRALSGRNYKERWMTDWKKIKDAEKRQRRALQSPLLRRAYDDYEAAFRANLNNSYAGLNALSLLMVEVVLAERYPDSWAIVQGREGEARRKLKLHKQRIEKLISALAFTMESERCQLEQQNRVDFWFEILEAVFLLLTSSEPKHVEQAYLEAVIWAPAYAEERMQRGLDLYRELSIEKYGEIDIKKNLELAIDAIKNERQQHSQSGRILLFAGLRLEDEKSKANPKPTPEAQETEATTTQPSNSNGWPKKAEISYLPTELVDEAKKQIKAKIQEEKKCNEILFGMAGGSSGCDLLFHELCDEGDLKIPTRLYLSLPKDQYIGEYVAPVGADWVERFNTIYRIRESAEKTARRNRPAPSEADAAAEPGEAESDVEKAINFLASTKEMPRWLQGKAEYNIERRCHVWMLQHALMQRHVYGRAGLDVEVTLIVLWDGGVKEGVGHLGHLIELAERHGIKVVKINCHEWSHASDITSGAAS